MAMKELRRMPLSEVDFVGLKEEDLAQTTEPIDVLALVFDYEMKRLDEIEKAIEKRKEEGYRPQVCEFRGTDASSRRKKKESKLKQEKARGEQVCLVSVTDHPMVTRTSARAKGRRVLVDEDVQLTLNVGRKSVMVDEELQLTIGGKSVMVDEELQLSIGRARSKGKSVLVDMMDIGEASSTRLLSLEDTTDALEKMDIGEGSSSRLLPVEATVNALENMDIREGSSSSLFDAQVTGAAELSKSRKRSKKQSKKPEKKPRVEVNTGPDPPPALPDFFQERIATMGGVNPVLVLQKALFKTDLGFQQNRLSIPVRAMRTEFRTDEEKAFLESKDNSQAINTEFLDTKGNQWIMPLRLWEMKKQTGRNSSKILALTNPWIKVALDANNNLVIGDVIQLWAFRIGEKLGLALVKL